MKKIYVLVLILFGSYIDLSAQCSTSPIVLDSVFINVPTCEDVNPLVTIKLMGESSSPTKTFYYEVSTDNVTWYTIWMTKETSIQMRAEQIASKSPGLTYGKSRYIRVRQLGCQSRTSNTETLKMLYPPPKIAISVQEATCKYWKSDDNLTGKDAILTFKNESSNHPSDKFLLELTNEAGISANVTLQTPYLSSETIKATDFPLGSPLHNLAFKPGVWVVEVTNYALGDCSVTHNITIRDQPQILATETFHKHLQCYESTTEGSEIRLGIASTGVERAESPITYTLEKVVGSSVTSATITRSGGTDHSPRFTGLAEGVYRIKVKDWRNCSGYVVSNPTDEFRNIYVIRPSLLSVLPPELENHNGYHIDCKGQDGMITAKARGGSYNTSLGSYQAYILQGGTVVAGPTNMTIPSGDNTVKSATFVKTAGTYKIRVTDGNGCTKESANFTLTEPASRPINAASITTLANGYHLLCPGDQNASGGMNPSGGIPPYTFRWGTNTSPSVRLSSDQYFDQLSVGSYRATVTDANGCMASQTVTVTAPPPMQLTTSVTSDYGDGRDLSCFGLSDASAKVTITANPNPPYSYEWVTNGDFSEETFGISAGTHTVKVRNKYDCEVAATVTIENPPKIDITPFVASSYNGSHISCYGEKDATLDVSVTNAYGQLQFDWTNETDPVTPFSTNKLVNEIGPGLYTVHVTDQNNCSASADVVVAEPRQLSVNVVGNSDYNGELISCYGGSNASLAAQPSGGTGAYSFMWSNGITSSTPVDLSSGFYSVTVKDANNCAASASFQIVDPPALQTEVVPTSNYHGQLISCHGTSDASFKANVEGGTGAYSFLWNDGSTVSARSAQSSGDYSVIVNDENGCTTSAQISVPEPDIVSLQVDSIREFGGYEVRCFGESNGRVDVSGRGGTGSYIYQWEDGPALDIWENISAGTYSVTVEDENGCSASESFTLTQPDQLVVSVESVTPSLCYGGTDASVMVTSSGGVGTRLHSADNTTWFNGSIINGIGSGSQSVFVKDDNGCIAISLVDIPQPEEMIIEVLEITPAYCSDPRGGASVIATGGAGSLSYLWTSSSGEPLSNSNSIASVSAGLYQLIITDKNNCTVDEEIAITNEDGPVISIAEIVSPLCHNSTDGKAVIEVEGNGPFNIHWSNDQLTEQATDLGEGIYFAEVIDNNDCLSIKEILIDAPDPIQISLLSQSDVTCYGFCDGRIEILPTGGNGNYVIDWSNQSHASSITDLCSGEYSVSVLDKNNCKAEKSFFIVQPQPLEVSLSSSAPETCFNKCDGFLNVLATGGTGDISYAWSNGNSLPKISDLCVGEYLITATDANRCSVTEIYEVTGPELLQISLANEIIPTCKDGCDGILSVTSSGGNGGYQYTWYDGETEQEKDLLCPGTYSVSVTDKIGCQSAAEYFLENQEGVVVNMEKEMTICTGQTYSLDPGLFASYSWTSNNGFSASNRVVKLQENGLYKLEVTTTKGCKGEAEFILQTSDDLLTAQFIIVPEAHVGDTLIFIDVTWPVADNISWEFPIELEEIGMRDGDLLGKFDIVGEYKVGMHANLALCHDFVEKTITIYEQEEVIDEGGRLGHEEELKSFDLSPNPNRGIFDARIEFITEHEVWLSVIDATSGKILARVKESGKSLTVPFDLSPLGSGVYILRMDDEHGTYYLRFVVN